MSKVFWEKFEKRFNIFPKSIFNDEFQTKKLRMSKVFWKKFEKIVSQIGSELRRVSEMIETQRLSKMLKLSDKVHEGIILQYDPDSEEDEVEFIVRNYPEISPFYYPDWRDCLMERYGSENIEEIDKTYEVAKNAISSSNPFDVVVAAERNLIGNDDDVDLLDYYWEKYFKSHTRALRMWEEKIVSDRREFEKTLKAWVGLLVPDESVSEHYYQVISETLSPYSIRGRKPKLAV